VKCDVLVPAALEHQITLPERVARAGPHGGRGGERPDDARCRPRAARPRRRCACPTSCAARAASPSRTSSGPEPPGVLVGRGQVGRELEKVMKRAYQEVAETGRRHKTDLRTGRLRPRDRPGRGGVPPAGPVSPEPPPSMP
jgi:hypothetical protein